MLGHGTSPARAGEDARLFTCRDRIELGARGATMCREVNMRVNVRKSESSLNNVRCCAATTVSLDTNLAVKNWTVFVYSDQISGNMDSLVCISAQKFDAVAKLAAAIS
jgi:hypothetical protein